MSSRRRSWAFAGAAAAGGLLAAGALAGGRQGAWRRDTDALTARLTRPPAGGVVRFDDLDGLPPPVGRYLRRCLRDGQPLVRRCRLTQAGQFRTGPQASDWRPFTATQTMAAAPPGFVWSARIAMLPGVPVLVRDAYVSGAGSMRAALAGLFPIVDQHDRAELDQGALQRYLAEAPWCPTALLPGQGVTWTPIDDRAALATLTDGATTASLSFHFDAAGDLSRVDTPARAREVNGRYEPTPWRGDHGRYETYAGMRVPTEAEVCWLLPGGASPYFRGRIVAAEYLF